MAKYVQDTNAAKSIRASIVLNKKGEHVATVQAHFSNGGAVLVNVFDYKSKGECFQQGRASGYGYDKYAAALAGLVIDGHTIADHCGRVPEDDAKRARLYAAYQKAENTDTSESRKLWQEKAEKIGARWANWDSSKGKWTSLHFTAGLERLEAFGYKVFQAI